MKYVTLLFFVGLLFGNRMKIHGQKEKTLIVKEIENDGETNIQKVSELLEQQADLQTIDMVNWDAFDYTPNVQFRMAYCSDEIWLKYYVEETNILAAHTETNSYVSKDSCVEFFFDPLGNGDYYNFEFNCIGTALVQYTPYGKEPQFLAPELIENNIEISSSLGHEPFSEKIGNYKWEMTIVIPITVLIDNHDIHIKGLDAKANFYKCGSGTSRNHYLSWNPITSKKPNFHLPQYFGNLVFE